MREREGQRDEASQQTAVAEQAPVEGARSERQAAGQIPPVHVAAAGAQGQTASELAYEDQNVTELKTKVDALVTAKFGGNFKKAFESYDSDHDGSIDKTELISLLKDADVGNAFTRTTWATKIIERLDKSADARIQWQEFESVFKALV